jgi:hypothetical protein
MVAMLNNTVVFFMFVSLPFGGLETGSRTQDEQK